MASDTGNDTNTGTGDPPGDQSLLTVWLAGGVNLTVAVLKALAGVFTGSGAMLSEAGHSVADTFTEVLLLTALRRSTKPADRRHPFGYGKERYLWSLLAAVRSSKTRCSPMTCWPSGSRWSRCRGHKRYVRSVVRRVNRVVRCDSSCG